MSFLAVFGGSASGACSKSSLGDLESQRHSLELAPFAEPEESSARTSGRGLSPKALERLERQVESLRQEAGVDDPSDPGAPAGNLHADVEAFTTLEACVNARALRDPLLADAVESLGYDTLLRDACRNLQALKLKTTAPCAPILTCAT